MMRLPRRRRADGCGRVAVTGPLSGPPACSSRTDRRGMDYSLLTVATTRKECHVCKRLGRIDQAERYLTSWLAGAHLPATTYRLTSKLMLTQTGTAR